MCDFTAVWGWLTATLVAIGGAVSSAIFGFVFIFAGPWQWLAAVGFFATAMWAALAAVFAVQMRDALDRYCQCTARIKACADACAGPARALIQAIGVTLTLLIVAAVVAAFTRNPISGGAALALATVLFGLAIALTVALVDVSRCQSTSPPTPPVPPSGTGTAPTG
jgi:hypothetical protein